jgi:formate dehydrogenase maturation protein FdhE
MKGKAAIFVNNKPLGIIENVAQNIWQGASRVESEHIFHYCPICGDIWARIIFEFGHGWRAHCVRCIKCNGTGTLDHYPLFKDTLERWPRELLEYELLTVKEDHRWSGFWRAI